MGNSNLLRDIVGNPFRSVKCDSAWQTPTTVALAETIYNDSSHNGLLDSDRLAVLADALEEAGCTAPEILGHLRGKVPHVKGCHCLDLLLGKS